MRRALAGWLAAGAASTALGPWACAGDETVATGAGGAGGGDLTIATGPSPIDPCSPDAGCAATSAQATVEPLLLYILLDRSGSMLDDQKWQKATAALAGFFASKDSAGLRVALGYFPLPQGCQATFYETPAVEAGALTSEPAPADAQEQALADSMSATQPSVGGGTPVFEALSGAYAWIAKHGASVQPVVLLVSDGKPEGCPGDTLPAIEALVAKASAEGDVRTFAIGLDAALEADLDVVAKAGGTGEAIVVGKADLEAELGAALAAVKISPVSCELDLPPPPDQGTLDPSLVNVCYAPGGGASDGFAHVASSAECGAQGSWYYDDDAMPTKVVLCPSTCQLVQADARARIDVVFGCTTIVP
jgi:hypothetical protein